ncbi:hypothetical protein HPP92_021323 [Vanilla planifolia]|uniref:Uncharacterized protein n=1 Tax=Vanilla planifolia TaxID=51239 RepID=A0A835PYX2_VANPL|nr:hypothetical protein HPP92_021323 [Vanilla planifolia]
MPFFFKLITSVGAAFWFDGGSRPAIAWKVGDESRVATVKTAYGGVGAAVLAAVSTASHGAASVRPAVVPEIFIIIFCSVVLGECDGGPRCRACLRGICYLFDQ